MAVSRAGGVTKGTMGQGKRQAQVFEVLVASSLAAAAASAKRTTMESNERKEEEEEPAADATIEHVKDGVEDHSVDSEGEQEEEEVLEGEALIDCTGNFGQRKWLGPGGRPAVGERAANGRIHASVPDVSRRVSVFSFILTEVVCFFSGRTTTTSTTQFCVINFMKTDRQCIPVRLPFRIFLRCRSYFPCKGEGASRKVSRQACPDCRRRVQRHHYDCPRASAGGCPK